VAIRLDVHEDGAFVVLTATGVVTERDFVGVHEEFFARPGSVGRLRLWLSDWTRAEAFEMSSGAVLDLARTAIEAVRAADHTGRVAMLVSADRVDRIAEVWQAFADQTGWLTLVTADRAEALAWLGRDRLPGSG
jgi:hypothetical protein